MTSAFTESISGWTATDQFNTGEYIGSVGIDSEPVAGSSNLVKSGGVADYIDKSILLKEIKEYVQINSAGLRSGGDNQLIQLASSSYNIRYYHVTVSGKYTLIVQNVIEEPNSVTRLYLCGIGIFNNIPEIGSIPVLCEHKIDDIVVGGVNIIDIYAEAGTYIAYNYYTSTIGGEQVITKLFSNANGASLITDTVENNNYSPVSSHGVNLKINELFSIGYLYVGTAYPITVPQIGSQKIFYIATEPGVYTNFNNLQVPEGISILSWNGNVWDIATIFNGSLYIEGEPVEFENVGTVPKSTITNQLKVVRNVTTTYNCKFITIPTDTTIKKIGISFDDYVNYVYIVRACVVSSLGDIVTDLSASITCDSSVYYKACTNSHDKVYDWIDITDDMRGKYLIVSSHDFLSLKLFYSQFCNAIDKINEEISVLTEEVDELKKETPLEDTIPTNYDGLEIATFNKILCIGDSLTYGTANYNNIEGETFPNSDNPKFSFPKYLTKITGVETVNMGNPGVSADGWWNAHNNDDLSGYTAAIIQLGVNGSLDTFMTETRTALINIINKLKQENQGIYIFFAGIINGLSYPSANEGESYYQKDQYLRQIFDDIHNGYTENNVVYDGYDRIFFIDHVAYGHIRTLNPWKTKLSYRYDNYNEGHLSAYGYWRLARDYAAYISWYMATDQVNIFRNIRYVGTPFSYV